MNTDKRCRGVISGNSWCPREADEIDEDTQGDPVAMKWRPVFVPTRHHAECLAGKPVPKTGRPASRSAVDSRGDEVALLGNPTPLQGAKPADVRTNPDDLAALQAAEVTADRVRMTYPPVCLALAAGSFPGRRITVGPEAQGVIG